MSGSPWAHTHERQYVVSLLRTCKSHLIRRHSEGGSTFDTPLDLNKHLLTSCISRGNIKSWVRVRHLSRATPKHLLCVHHRCDGTLVHFCGVTREERRLSTYKGLRNNQRTSAETR